MAAVTTSEIKGRKGMGWLGSVSYSLKVKLNRARVTHWAVMR